MVFLKKITFNFPSPCIFESLIFIKSNHHYFLDQNNSPKEPYKSETNGTFKSQNILRPKSVFTLAITFTVT